MNNNQLCNIYRFLEDLSKESYSEKTLLFKNDLPNDFDISLEYPLESWYYIVNTKVQNDSSLLLDNIKRLNEIGYDLLELSDVSILLFIFDLKVIFKLFSYELLDEILLNCDGYNKLIQLLVLESVNKNTKIFLLNFLFDLIDKNVLDNSFFSKSIFYASNYVYHLELKNDVDERVSIIGDLTLKLTNQLFSLYPKNDLLSLIVSDSYSVNSKTAMFLISNINKSVIKQILSCNTFNIDNYVKEISDLFKILLFAMSIGPDQDWKKAVLENIHLYSGIILGMMNSDVDKFNGLIMYSFSNNEKENWKNIVINENI